MKQHDRQQEYDFALVLEGISELTQPIEDALFEAGCDDATFGIQYGRVYVDFSRSAASLKDAILSAVRDIRNAGVGADVLRVDECSLVTQSDIARRSERSRQQINQFINGQRGPGGFPAPDCHLTDGVPLWSWCAVSRWLCENDMIRPDACSNAEVVAVVNAALKSARLATQNPALVAEVANGVARHAATSSR